MNADLSQLKDLHLPQEPSVWPLAAGWWLVILCALAVVIALSVLFVLYWTGLRRTTWQEFKRLSGLPDNAYLPALNKLLKRVAIHNKPSSASLYGKAWFSFLNKTKDVSFTQEDIDLFQKRLYNGSVKMKRAQREHIHSCATAWLKHNL